MREKLVDESALMAMWKAVYDEFEPSAPANADQHVARDRYNPVTSEVCVQLRLPVSHQKFILAGGIGSGKSTELRAVLQDLHQDKDVLFLDLVEHYQSAVRDPYALERVEAVELIGLVGLAVLRMGREQLGVSFGDHERRFSEALNRVNRREDGGPTLDVVKLSRGVGMFVGVAAGAALGGPAGAALAAPLTQGVLSSLDAIVDAWEWRVGLFNRAARGDQDPSVRDMLTATNALLDHLRAARQRPLVIIVDGLDRVREEEIFAALLLSSRLLAELRADLVITVDLSLVERHRAGLRAWTTRDFTYVPVAQKDAPTTPDPRGVDFLAQVAERRLMNLGYPTLIPREHLKRLGYYSSGSARDFVTLVRNVAIQAMINKASTATDKEIDVVLDRHRREQEAGLNRAHLDCLVQMLADPDRTLPKGEVADDLCKRQLVLAYPNEPTWFLPHTALIWKILRRPGQSTYASS